MNQSPRWSRVLIKLSGEAFAGGRDFGFDPATFRFVATELASVHNAGVEVAVVVGGGNVMRGVVASESGMERVAADGIGMLATVQNAVALQDALEKFDVDTRVQTAIPMSTLAEPFIRRRAMRHLEKRRVVILAAGTGNPYFSTDTAVEHKLGVMDMTAFALCAENDLPIVVFSIEGEGNMRRAIFGEGIGTVVMRNDS